MLPARAGGRKHRSRMAPFRAGPGAAQSQFGVTTDRDYR
jgi:hypothetical protein